MTDGDRYEDGALAAKARAGDEQAFAELFSRYKGVVRSVSNGFFLAGGPRGFVRGGDARTLHGDKGL